MQRFESVESQRIQFLQRKSLSRQLGGSERASEQADEHSRAGSAKQADKFAVRMT